MEQRELIDSLATLSMVVHIFAFVIYNKWRVNSIINYLTIRVGNEQNLLRKRQLAELLDNYTSPFGYVFGFPAFQTYTYLYSNSSFLSFYKKAKFIAIYFCAFLILFISLEIALY